MQHVHTAAMLAGRAEHIFTLAQKNPPINLTKCFEIKIFTRLRSNLSKEKKACM